jgi:hypothetical protein
MIKKKRLSKALLRIYKKKKRKIFQMKFMIKSIIRFIIHSATTKLKLLTKEFKLIFQKINIHVKTRI